MPRTKLAEKHSKKEEPVAEEEVSSVEVETTELYNIPEAKQETTPKATTTPKKEQNNNGDVMVNNMVDQILDHVRPFTVRYNRDGRAVVDLAQRGEMNGVRYRQLWVQVMPGHMLVSVMEGFNSAHGGTTSPSTVAHFKVPVGETAAYDKIYRRFFGYAHSKNLQHGSFLVDTLKQTVAS